jgi:hypothetical protein
MSGAETPLNGRWIGIYNYPDDSPPVPFDAVLFESGGRISGTIEEVDEYLGDEHLTATVDGSRDGEAVRFAKFYDNGDEDFDTVLYDGTVKAESTEIHGRWEIPGIWSGSFIMTREIGAETAIAVERGETVR